MERLEANTNLTSGRIRTNMTLSSSPFQLSRLSVFLFQLNAFGYIFQIKKGKKVGCQEN